MPTRIDPPSATLIDNIFTNNITDEIKSTSGIIINEISDHKMIFTHVENCSYVEQVNKYIEIETNDETSITNFVNEFNILSIEEKLNSNPQANYDRFSSLLTSAKYKYSPNNLSSITRKTQKIKIDN